MSRSEKTLIRIEALEREYLSLLRDALVDDQGPGSGLLSAIVYPLVYHRGPRKQLEYVSYDQLERLSKEIKSLRWKAGEPVPGPALSVIASFRSKYDALGTQQRPGDWNRFQREALRETEALIASAESARVPK